MIDCIKLIGIKLVQLNEYLYNRVKNGNPIRLNECDKEVGLIYNNELIALYERSDEKIVNDKYSYKVKILWR